MNLQCFEHQQGKCLFGNSINLTEIQVRSPIRHEIKFCLKMLHLAGHSRRLKDPPAADLIKYLNFDSQRLPIFKY